MEESRPPRPFVLGICGSPRPRSNTRMLLERALAGAAAAGAQVELVSLRELQMESCSHCLGCDATGRCVVPDEMQQVYPKLRAAQHLVLASPIHFAGVSAETKTMVDRGQASWVETYRLKRKPFDAPGERRGLFIATCGGRDLRVFEWAKPTVKAFLNSCGFGYWGELFEANTDRPPPLPERAEVLAKAESLGRRLVDGSAMASGLLAGVDVGGTKIAVGVADRDGRIIASRRAPTPQQGGVQVVSQIVALLEQVLSEARLSAETLAAIGVAVPAVIDQRRGLVLWAPNIVGWQQQMAVARPISDALGAPASLHYDGHAWAAGEWWCGAARGAREVALIAVGTGIGGGLILDGRLHRGRVGVAGAIGWWVADWRQAGAPRPESQGWLESLASGPAIARAAGRATADEALQAARAGDPASWEAVERAAQALGAAAANIVSLVDPEVVVMAGGVIAGGADLLLPRITEIVKREAQPQMARGVRVVCAELGEDAAWLGAARLAALRLQHT